jgi:hypothetical protein
MLDGADSTTLTFKHGNTKPGSLQHQSVIGAVADADYLLRPQRLNVLFFLFGGALTCQYMYDTRQS